VSTGPLGQGISNAVGLAIAAAHMADRFNRPGFQIIDNFTYCIVGDGCLQEGVALEAIALAGHLKLGKLIALYDDNHIQIDGDTAFAFSENVCSRFEACGWHTLIVDDGDHDLASIEAAIEAAKLVLDQPSLIKIRYIKVNLELRLDMARFIRAKKRFTVHPSKKMTFISSSKSLGLMLK
jgi:transketolase